MKKQEIQNKLATIRNGAYTNIMFLSDIISNKDNKEHKVQKLVKAVVRFGVKYSHINVESIQARPVVEGESKPLTEQLPWGEWDPECDYLIAHKDTHYLRCTVSRSPNHHRKVSYLLDGQPATLEKIMPLVRSSELAPRNRDEYVFNPKIENVLALGKEAR